MGEESEANAGSDLADPPADEDRKDGEPQDSPSDDGVSDPEPATESDVDASETPESDADSEAPESDADSEAPESDADAETPESGDDASGSDAGSDDGTPNKRWRRRQHVQRRRQRASVDTAARGDSRADDSDSDDSEPDAGDGQQAERDADDDDAEPEAGDEEDHVPTWQESSLVDDPVSDWEAYGDEAADEGDSATTDGADDDAESATVTASDAERASELDAETEPELDAETEPELDAETEPELDDSEDREGGDEDAGDEGGDDEDDEEYVPPWEQPNEVTAAAEPTTDAEGDAASPTDGATEELSAGAYAEDDDDFLRDGPESDQEMPLAAHIEEMVKRLSVVLLFGGAVTLLLFPGGELLDPYLNTNLLSATDVINYLWNTHIPNAPELPDRRPRVYGPLELILTELKVAALAGFVVSLPVFVYETYLFMRPGLYPRERRYYLAAVPTSLVLALVGVAFAHFIVLPAIFAYFTSYTVGTAVIAFGLKETFNLILVLMGYMALVFQIPLFIMLAIMMGLVTREWLSEKRLLFWGGFLGVAFLVSPDPTGMAPIIVGATMIGLFEGTLALLKWTGN